MEKKWEIQDVPPKPIVPDRQVGLILTPEEVGAIGFALQQTYGSGNPTVTLFREIERGLKAANA